MEPKSSENHEEFQKFLDFCNNALIEDSKPLEIMKLIRKRYKECDEDFLDSDDFYELLVTSHARILGDRGKFFVYLKEFLNALKQNRRTKPKSDNGIKRCLDTDHSSDSDSDQHIKRRRFSSESCSEDNNWSMSNHQKSSLKSIVYDSTSPLNHFPSRLDLDSESTKDADRSQDNGDADLGFNQECKDKEQVKLETNINISDNLADNKVNEADASDKDPDIPYDNVVEYNDLKGTQDTINESNDKEDDRNDTGFEIDKTETELCREDAELEQVEENPDDIQGSPHSDVDTADSQQSGNPDENEEYKDISPYQDDHESSSAGIINMEENINNSCQIIEEELELSSLSQDNKTDKPSTTIDEKVSGCSDTDLPKKERMFPQFDSDLNEQSSEAVMSSSKSGNKDKFTSWLTKARSKFKTLKDETDSSNDNKGVRHFPGAHVGKLKYSSSSSSDDDNHYRKETKQKRDKRQKKYKICVGKGSKKDKDRHLHGDYKTKKTSPKDKLSPTKMKDKGKTSPKKSPILSIHKSPILIVTDSESEEEPARSLTPLDKDFCEEKRQMFGIKSELMVKVEKIKCEFVGVRDINYEGKCLDFESKDSDSEQVTKDHDIVNEVKEQELPDVSDHEELKTKSEDESINTINNAEDKTEPKPVKKRITIVTEVLFDKNKHDTKIETVKPERLEHLDRKSDSDNKDHVREVTEGKSIFKTDQNYPSKRGSTKESSDQEGNDNDDDNNDDDVKDLNKCKEGTERRKDDAGDVQPSTSSESAHSNPKIVKGSAKQVKRLERLLEQIRDKIENVRKRELDLDDLNSNVSDYILEDRLQQKFVKVWKKLCDIHNSASSTGRPTEKYFKYQGTRYPDVNKKIEKFINKKKVFPDYHDVRNIIVKVNKDNKLHLRPKMIDDLAREAFTDVGNKLQRRRKKDFRENIDTQDVSLYSVYDDPALYDTDLKKKLDANKRAAKSSIEKVVDKYARLQYEDGDKDGSNNDDDDAENDEEEEDEEDPIETAENQPTKEIDQDVILLLEEDEEEMDSDNEQGKKKNDDVDPKYSTPITKVKKEVEPEKTQTFSDGKSQYFGEIFGLQNTQPKPKEHIDGKENLVGSSSSAKEPVKTHKDLLPTIKRGTEKSTSVIDKPKIPAKSHLGPVIKTGSKKSSMDTAAVCKQVTDILTKEFSQGVIEINSDDEENAQLKPTDKPTSGSSSLKQTVTTEPSNEPRSTTKDSNILRESAKGDIKKDYQNTGKSDLKKKDDDVVVIDLEEDEVQIVEEQLPVQNGYNADEYYDYNNYDNQYYDQSYYENQYYDNQYYGTDSYKTDFKKEKEKDKKSTTIKRTSGWHYETPALNLKITSPRHISVNDHLGNKKHSKHKPYFNGSKEKIYTSVARKGNPEQVKPSTSKDNLQAKSVDKVVLTSSECIEIDLDEDEDKNSSQIMKNNYNNVKVSVYSSENNSNTKEILICDSPEHVSELSLKEKQNLALPESAEGDSIDIIDQDDNAKEVEIDDSIDNNTSIKVTEKQQTNKDDKANETLAISSIEVVPTTSDKIDSGTIHEVNVSESFKEDKNQADDEGEESELEEGEIIYPEDDSGDSCNDDDDDDGREDQTSDNFLENSQIENPKQVDNIGEESNASSDRFVAIPVKLYDNSDQVLDTGDELDNEYKDNELDENIDEFTDHIESTDYDLEQYDDGNSLEIEEENNENDISELSGSPRIDNSKHLSNLNKNSKIYSEETSQEMRESDSFLSKVNMDELSEKDDATFCESNPDIFDDEGIIDNYCIEDQSILVDNDSIPNKNGAHLGKAKIDGEIDLVDSCIFLDTNVGTERVTSFNDNEDSSSQCSESLFSGVPEDTNNKSLESSHKTKLSIKKDISKSLENYVEKHADVLISSPKDSCNEDLDKFIEIQGTQVKSMCSENRKSNNYENECSSVGDTSSISNNKPDSLTDNVMEVDDYSDNEEENYETINSVQKALSILDDDKLNNDRGEGASDNVVSNSVQDEETVTSTSKGNTSVIKLKQPDVRNKLMKLKNAIKKFPTETIKKPDNVVDSGQANSLLQVEDKHIELIENYEEPDSYLFKKGDTLVSSSVEELVELSDSD